SPAGAARTAGGPSSSRATTRDPSVLRLFVPSAQATGRRIRITGPELRHLRTLRLSPGAQLIVFDERGDEHDVRVEQLGARAAEVAVLATRRPVRESALELTLAPALLKGTKMDLVIEKATELGVRRIAPVASRHAIATACRTDRWQRIAVAAAKQSGRTQVPTVEAPRSLAELVRQPWPGLRLLAWEAERDRSLTTLPPPASHLLVAVGPERRRSGGMARRRGGRGRARRRLRRHPAGAPHPPGRDGRARGGHALPAPVGRPVLGGRGRLASVPHAPPPLRHGSPLAGAGRQGHDFRVHARGRAPGPRAVSLRGGGSVRGAGGSPRERQAGSRAASGGAPPPCGPAPS